MKPIYYIIYDPYWKFEAHSQSPGDTPDIVSIIYFPS